MNLNKILEQIAIKNCVSITQVRQDIQKALDKGRRSSDEKVREYWSKIPTKHKKPTVEEVILYIVTECIRECSN